MGQMNKILPGLALLTKYDQDCYVSAEHDVIYAGSDKTHRDKISESDLKLLDILGWRWEQESGSWARFV